MHELGAFAQLVFWIRAAHGELADGFVASEFVLACCEERHEPGVWISPKSCKTCTGIIVPRAPSKPFWSTISLSFVPPS